jgi:hypothetical protein
MIISNYCVNCFVILTVLQGQIISAPGNTPGINGNNNFVCRPERAV